MKGPDIMISVIIPTKDREGLLEMALLHLDRALAGVSSEIIVVNDSKSATLKPHTGVTILNNPQSGVASARNMGATTAHGTWLLFLDDDMLIFPANIRSYLVHLDRTGKFTVNLDWVYPPETLKTIQLSAFGRFLIKYGFTSLEGWNKGLRWQKNAVFHGTGITSQNLFIKKEVFEETGGYPQDMPHAGFEDYLFSKQLKEHEIEFLIDTTSQMYHNEADRIEPVEWLKRKERNGETRKAAVLLGHAEVEATGTSVSSVLYRFRRVIKPLLRITLAVSTLSKGLDRFSFGCYKLLLGLALLSGYHRRKKL